MRSLIAIKCYFFISVHFHDTTEMVRMVEDIEEFIFFREVVLIFINIKHLFSNFIEFYRPY